MFGWFVNDELASIWNETVVTKPRLYQGSIEVMDWRDWEKLRNSSVRTANDPTEIRNRLSKVQIYSTIATQSCSVARIITCSTKQGWAVRFRQVPIAKRPNGLQFCYWLVEKRRIVSSWLLKILTEFVKFLLILVRRRSVERKDIILKSEQPWNVQLATTFLEWNGTCFRV
jgi:hypothetical protein